MKDRWIDVHKKKTTDLNKKLNLLKFVGKI